MTISKHPPRLSPDSPSRPSKFISQSFFPIPAVSRGGVRWNAERIRRHSVRHDSGRAECLRAQNASDGHSGAVVETAARSGWEIQLLHVRISKRLSLQVRTTLLPLKVLVVVKWCFIFIDITKCCWMWFVKCCCHWLLLFVVIVGVKLRCLVIIIVVKWCCITFSWPCSCQSFFLHKLFSQN